MTNETFVFVQNELTNSFSDSFKEELKQQLYFRFYHMFGKPLDEAEIKFHLVIGINEYVEPEPGEMVSNGGPEMPVVKNGYVFLTTLLSVGAGRGYHITICWTSPNFEDLMEIHRSDITGKDVSFYWCADFPKDEILEGQIENTTPVNIRKKNETGYGFDVSYFLHEFPDVCVFFDFEGKPSDEVIAAIDIEIKNYSDTVQTIFAHEVTIDKTEYYWAINHNTIDFNTYGDDDFQKDVDNLDLLLQSINKNPSIKNLKHIRFI